MNFIERFQNPIILFLSLLILVSSVFVFQKGWRQAYVEEEVSVLQNPDSQPLDTLSAQIEGKININTASAELLETLPGIGPSYAQRIIEYRDSHGGFKTIEEVQNVQGIGPKTYERIRDRITVE